MGNHCTLPSLCGEHKLALKQFPKKKKKKGGQGRTKQGLDYAHSRHVQPLMYGETEFQKNEIMYPSAHTMYSTFRLCHKASYASGKLKIRPTPLI